MSDFELFQWLWGENKISYHNKEICNWLKMMQLMVKK